jgi:hypothetical protein
LTGVAVKPAQTYDVESGSVLQQAALKAAPEKVPPGKKFFCGIIKSGSSLRRGNPKIG